MNSSIKHLSHIHMKEKSLRSARNKMIKQHLTTYQARLYYNISIDQQIDKREKKKTTIDIYINQKFCLEYMYTYL